MIVCFQAGLSQNNNDKRKISLKDSLDGAFDISEFLMDPKGFVPVPFVITEQATGYGGGATFITFHEKKTKDEGYVPPSMTGLVGFGTENGTWGAGLFHFHVWGVDKVRYTGFIGKPDVNINYFGNGNDYLRNNPVEYNLDSWVTYHRVLVRLGASNFFAGGSYVYFQTNTTFNEFTDRPIINRLLESFEGKSKVSTIRPMLNWDSRNNIFTPTKGIYTGFSFTYNATWLGADDDFYAVNPYFFGYLPISERVNSGWRLDSAFVFENAPFYAFPFVQMRGVPLMKHQNEKVVLAETEWNIKLVKRWSMNLFTGAGKAFNEFNNFDSAEWVYSYGFGLRYRLARLFGVDAGIDFAWSNDDDFAFSFVFGSAWLR